MTVATVELETVRTAYPDGTVAVRDVDLRVADGELLVLVGPSGCGKSTVLRTVAGLEAPASGRVRIGGRDVTDVAPRDRDVAMVFQDYALYPHMTVRENLSFGLRMRGVEAGERSRRVEEVAGALGLADLLERTPRQLSGGQRQRVALGRATVREPRVFLFDEPLSNLDARLRAETRTQLARLHRRLGATMIYVTHDQEEAVTLGERVGVMHEGRLEQVGRPMDVYRRPATRFVGGFVGSPAMNFFPGRLAGGREGAVFRGRGLELALPEVPPPADRREVVLGVRPDDVDLASPGDGDLRAEVDVVEPLGSRVLVHLRARPEPSGPGGGTADPPPRDGAVAGADAARDAEIRLLAAPDAAPAVGATTGLRLRRDRLHLFDAGSGRRLAAADDG